MSWSGVRVEWHLPIQGFHWNFTCLPTKARHLQDPDHLPSRGQAVEVTTCVVCGEPIARPVPGNENVRPRWLPHAQFLWASYGYLIEEEP